MIFLLQRTGQGQNFLPLDFRWIQTILFYRELRQGRNFFALIFFYMVVNDIFITGYWAGPELLCFKIFISM